METSDDADFPAEPSPDSIHWVSKRDGSVTAFDPDKLYNSIFRALERVEGSGAAFHAQEISPAVLHFLAVEFEGLTPSTAELAESIVKILREIGQAPTAAAYHDFRAHREKLRQSMQVLPPAEGFPRTAKESRPSYRTVEDDTNGDKRVESWDKGRIVWTLETEADVDPTNARMIAAAVERRLLACELGRIPAGLIRELIDCELMERGMQRALNRRRLMGVETRSIERLLVDRPDPDHVHRSLGREVMRQYSLQEVYAADIAGLHEEGLIHLFHADCPSHWAAQTLDVLSVASHTADSWSLISRLEPELEELCRCVEGAIAIDSIDGVVALGSESNAEPETLAEQLIDVLRRSTRGRRTALILNLHGRITEAVAAGMSEGPLFRVRPSELQDRFAHRFALHFAERLFEDPQLSTQCRIDFHPDVHQDESDLRLSLRHWGKWAHRGFPVRFCFDRDLGQQAEGLSALPTRQSEVYQYVGIRLPLLYRRIGKGSDDETLILRLGPLCEAAVRAGMQKREFLRRQHPERFAGADRGTVVVAPIGLDALVADMIGKSIAQDEAALSFAEQIIARLARRLRSEARSYRMNARIDGVPWANGGELNHESAIGCTPAVPGVGPRHQIIAAGRLHAAAAGGSVFCRLSSNGDFDVDQIIDLAAHAAKHTAVNRLGFVFPAAARQPRLAEDWD